MEPNTDAFVPDRYNFLSMEDLPHLHSMLQRAGYSLFILHGENIVDVRSFEEQAEIDGLASCYAFYTNGIAGEEKPSLEQWQRERHKRLNPRPNLEAFKEILGYTLALKGKQKSAVLWLNFDRIVQEGLKSLVEILPLFENFEDQFAYYIRDMQKANRHISLDFYLLGEGKNFPRRLSATTSLELTAWQLWEINNANAEETPPHRTNSRTNFGANPRVVLEYFSIAQMVLVATSITARGWNVDYMNERWTWIAYFRERMLDIFPEIKGCFIEPTSACNLLMAVADRSVEEVQKACIEVLAELQTPELEGRCLVLESKASVEENLRLVDGMVSILKQREIDAVAAANKELYQEVSARSILIEEPPLSITA